MFKKTPLASAVGAITAAALAAVPVQAQEDAPGASEEVEEMIVTGSRIRRAVDDSPSPVTVIERAEIEMTGLESVADVLRSTTYNSFGSFRERSGTSFGQIALIDLRGLGPDRTAVLVNGRRVPGNPFTGSASVDLNSIPLSAIERIEILTDSASAIYGTDALGGVVNVILRDDYEGVEMKFGAANPQRAGAEEDNLSFSWGSAGEKGNLLFTAEWFTRNPIFDGDRDYSKVDVRDPGDGTRPNLGVDTTGVSAGGNTAFHPWFAAAEAIGDCPMDVYAGIVEDPFGIPGTACGFGYADISAQTGGLDRISTFLTGSYEWTPGHELFMDNRYSRISSFGRYAPAVGFFSVPHDSPHNPFDTSLASYPKDANGVPLDFSVFHRFVAHGPRDDDTVRYEFDTAVGGRGSFEFANPINYEAYARFYRYEGAEEGETYILQSQVELEVEAGNYDLTNPFSRDPVNLAAVGRMGATLFRDILTDYTSAGVTFDGFAWNLPAGPIGWAAGAETASEEYMDDYDSYREAGNILGSAGNSSGGDRSRSAIFGEVSIPVLDNLEASVAGRFDSYDDFGDAFSPQVAVRYSPFQMLVLRASWGEGFKAPNLTELYQSRSQSFNDTTDVFRCAAIGIDPCPTNQVENFTGGNPDLDAETAESFNLGIVVQPLESLSFSIDAYQITIEDSVAQLGIGTVLRLEQEGRLPSGVAVRRGAPTQAGDPGALVSIDRVFANLAIQDVSGYDLRAQYDWETADWGRLAFNLTISRIEAYEFTPSPGEDVVDLVGLEGNPQHRAIFNVQWDFDRYTVAYYLRVIDEHEGAGNGMYERHFSQDITAATLLPWGGELTLGIRNLMDEDPAYDLVNGYDDSFVLPLYDVAGRTPFMSYRHTF
ncbi:MAG: TonB-dependent receptor [Gammaproteobacteria bacterium]|nr:TonB-dependent receptor [Gammaproteobacteria bacterium]